MIEQSLSLVAAIWAAVGPGILLAAALPVLLIAFVLVMRVSMKKATSAG